MLQRQLSNPSSFHHTFRLLHRNPQGLALEFLHTFSAWVPFLGFGIPSIPSETEPIVNGTIIYLITVNEPTTIGFLHLFRRNTFCFVHPRPQEAFLGANSFVRYYREQTIEQAVLKVGHMSDLTSLSIHRLGDNLTNLHWLDFLN